MNARTSHKTEAIVLHTLDHGESDRIATFYTREFGKIKGIAKGARRSRRRFANALEPFSCANLIFSRKGSNSLALVDQCDMIDHFPRIRANLEKSMAASYLVELTGAFTVEGKKNESVFQLLSDFLAIMENSAALPALLSFFEIRLLNLTGYDPVLDRCTLCNTPLDIKRSYRFSNSSGGLKCNRCTVFHPAAATLSLGTIRSLLHSKEMPVHRLSRLILSRHADQECREMLVPFIRHLLDRELKSWQVLKQLQTLGALSGNTC